MKKKSYIQSWPTILAISALIWSTFGVSSVSASLVNSSSSTDLLSTGLVGHWTFDGKKTPWTSSTAGTTLDSSGNSNTGTLTSMVQSTNPVAGRIGQALTFDGSTDYISAGVPSNLTFTAASTFSVSAWIKTTQSGINTCISGKYDSTVGKGYFWCSLSGNVYMQMQTSQTIYIYRIGSTAIANGVWHHVVATYSGTSNASTGIKLYVDGVIEPTYSDTQTVGTLGSLAVSS
ncbi:MAG: LamG-like jellyroll fold domain-containing protein, partial [Patescibacteria group bacterium]